MPTLNSSNPLVTGLVFLAPFQENTLPYTDDAGGRSVVATDATIQQASPGPALAITTLTTSKAQSSTTPISAPPYTMAVIAYRAVIGTSSQVALSWSRDDAEYVTLGFSSNPSAARIRGGGVIVDVAGTSCATNTWHNLALIVGSNTSRSLYTNGSVVAGSSVSAVVGGSFFTPLTIGALQRGSLGENLYTGYIKWAAIWNRALTQTELNTFFSDPSALFVPPTQATGTITLDAFTLSGAFATGALSLLTGDIPLDAFALSGFLGLAPGRIDSSPFKNWTGTLLAGITIPRLTFLKLSDMSTVLQLTNQTIGGSGVLTVTNAAFTPGTTYLVVAASTDGASLGAEIYTAT